MLQHKQEERELKRVEGDIIKKQNHLRRSMLDYENSEYDVFFGKNIYHKQSQTICTG